MNRGIFILMLLFVQKKFILFLILLSTAVSPYALASADFYLTVERSFGTHESSELVVDFVKKNEPMKLRVLKPKNLESFLAGQLALSRSYEEPAAKLNPGHYIWKGVNKIQSPFEPLRQLLSVDFRQGMGEKFQKPTRNTGTSAIASVPASFFVSPPKGFTVVRETFLDLQITKNKDNQYVPGGDDDYYYGYGSFNQKVVKIEKLPAGLYLLQAVQGTSEAQAILQISDFAAQVKQSNREILLRLIDRKLAPVEGASLEIQNSKGKWETAKGVTDAYGELLVTAGKSDFESKLVMRAVKGEQYVFIDTEFLSVSANSSSVFILTDRPIFKPGEAFSYKGFIRSYDGAKLELPFKRNLVSSGSAVKTMFRSVNENTDMGMSSSKVNAFGSFSGSFQVPEEASPGLYQVSAAVDSRIFKGELRVKDYVKPTFYLTMENEEGLLRPGQKFTVSLTATQYSGGPANGAGVEAYVYRKKYEAPKWVEEAGGGLSTGLGYSGESAQASTYNQPQKLFSTLDERLASTATSKSSEDTGEESESKPKDDFWESAQKFDSNGKATLSFTLPMSAPGDTNEEWVYSLVIKARDRQGAMAVLTKNFYVTLSPVVSSVQFAGTLFDANRDDLLALVQTQLSQGGQAAETKGTLVLHLEDNSGSRSHFKDLDFVTDSEGKAKVAIPKIGKGGRLYGVVTLNSYGDLKIPTTYQSAESSVIVASDGGKPVVKNSNLELIPEKNILQPNEKGRVFVLLPENWGEKESGLLWQTIAGSQIHSHLAQKVEGRSLWLEVPALPSYGTGFYFTITVPMPGGKFAEQTVNFKILDVNKVLAININPQKSIAEPLKPLHISFLVTDHDKKPAPNTELTVSIVDRAVYAVQGEIRPRIFDFFYPLPRLNVMSFYSDELQGYGYSEEIRKPNFSLEAIKSSSQLQKSEYRDTAGFFPSVVTNSSGVANITVDMPANITEWLITAIALNADGQLGESTHIIRTATDVTLTPALASFMREGDELNTSVSVQNLSPKVAKVSLEVLGQNGVDSKMASKLELPPKQSELLPIQLLAKSMEGMGTVLIKGSVASLSFGGGGEFSIPLYPAGIMDEIHSERAPFGENRLVTLLPSSAKVTEVEVSAHYGLLGAALRASQFLVTYPYGCTEQLVHSTVPNLALLELMRQAKIPDSELGSLGPTLQRARTNASLGIKKLLAHQTESGGFVMWKGDSKPSLPITLIALSGLKMAADLGVEGAQKAYSQGASWVKYSEVNTGLVSSGSYVSDYENSMIQFYLGALELGDSKEISKWVTNVAANDKSSLLSLAKALDVLSHWKKQPQQAAALGALSQELQTIKNRLTTGLSQFSSEQHNQEVKATLVGQSQGSVFGFGAASSHVLASALGALRRQGELDPELLNSVKHKILNEFKGGYWRSTFDTAEIILSTNEILADEARALKKMEKSKQSPSLLFDGGEKIGDLKPILGGFSGVFKITDQKVSKLEKLELSGFPQNAIAKASFQAFIPDKEVKEKDSGFQMERKFIILSNGSKQETTSLDKLKVGDVVISIVKFSRTSQFQEGAIPSSFLIIDDSIPSLAEGVEEDTSYLADAGLTQKNANWQELKPKSVLRYPQKTSMVFESSLVGLKAVGEVTSVWRVKYKGKSSLPAAQAVDMYDSSIRGNTISHSVVAE